MRQFEVWWADLPAPIGRRPVLLLTRTPAYAYLSRVMVVEITSQIRRIPVEVSLSAKEGLRKPSVANLDNVHVVPRQSLSKRIGTLAPSRFVEVKRALGHALGWTELK